MIFPGFCGPSYKLSGLVLDRTINFQISTLEQGPRAGQKILQTIPGLPLYKTLPTFPLRALWSNATALFAIAGNTMYQVFDDATPNVVIGTLDNSPTPAMITSNGFQLAVSSNGKGYIAPGGGAGLIPIVDETGQPVNAQSMVFMNEVFIASIVQSKQIQISQLAPAGGDWDPADVATKEAYSDNIVRAWVDDPGGQYLWLFGDQTTEIWVATADLFPFQRMQSGVFSIGCDSEWSVAGVSGWRFWLWNNVIWGCSGFQPQRVSDYGVEDAIKSYSEFDKKNAEAFSWMDGGHIFYAISFPQASRTWVYDLQEKAWHERLYFSNGQYSRYRPRVYTKAFGKHLVGDYETGNIYSMDPTVYTDANGMPLRRQRVCPYFTDNEKNLRYNRLTLDMDTGEGLNIAQGNPGYNPQVALRYSHNRGKNWSNERQQGFGRIGQNDRRVIFPQLGSSYIGLAAEITVSDPAPANINGAYLDISPSTWPRS